MERLRIAPEGQAYAWRDLDGTFTAVQTGPGSGDDIWIAHLDLHTPQPPTAEDVRAARFDTERRGDFAYLVDRRLVPWWAIEVPLDGTPLRPFHPGSEGWEESWGEWATVPNELWNPLTAEPGPGDVLTVTADHDGVVLSGDHLDGCTLVWERPKLWPFMVILQGPGLPRGLDGVESLRIDGGGEVDCARLAHLPLLQLDLLQTRPTAPDRLGEIRGLRHLMTDFTGFTPDDLPGPQAWEHLISVDWFDADEHADALLARFPHAYAERAR